MKRAPDGVRLIALYHFVMALPGLIGSCAILFAMLVVLADAHSAGAIWPLFGMSIGLFFTFISAFAFPVVGIGLWRMSAWARWGAIALAILLLPAFPVWTVIGAAIIWYMFQRETKQAFEAEYQMPSEDFYRRFHKGGLGDGADFFEWSAFYDMYQLVRERLEDLEVEPA